MTFCSIALSSLLLIAAAARESDHLTLRELRIVDAHGVERVRIAAPLPDPNRERQADETR